MKQHDAINRLLEILTETEIIEACMVTGDIAIAKETEFSPIILYCVVPKVMQVVLRKDILPLFETYYPVLYCEEERKPLLKYHVIYENGVELFMTCCLKEELPNDENRMILYDPKQLITNEVIIPKITNKDIGKLMDQLSCDLFHFYCNQNNYPELLKLSINIHNIYLKLLKYQCNIFDINNNDLEELPKEVLKKYFDIMKLLKYDKLIILVQVITNEIDQITKSFSVDLISLYHLDFYQHCKKLIFSL